MSRSLQKSAIVSGLDQLRQDFSAAKSSRFQRRRTGIPSTGWGADYHYRTESDWLKLIEYARDMDRNDCVVGQTIDRAALNTIQGGFTLDVNTGDSGLDEDLAARWKDWAEDPEQCDATGEMPFAELEYLALRSALVDGDMIAVGRDQGFLQVYEAHRSRTPFWRPKDVIHGVKLSEQRRRSAYYISQEDIDPTMAIRRGMKFDRVDVRDKLGVRRVMHVRLSRRLSQTRGVTALAPVFDIAGMHDDLQFAAILKQQISACFVIFRKKSESWGPSTGDPQVGDREVQTRRDGSTRTVENVSPALEYEGDPGEDFQGFAPQVVGTPFFDHVRMILTLVGINLGVPLVMMLMDAKETNFSGWRGAVDQARIGFRHNQRRMMVQWHRPIFNWKVSQWAARDSVLMRSVKKFSKNGGPFLIPHDWNPPMWPYIDPKADREADAIDVGNCLASAREVDARNGRDFFTKVDRIIEERVGAIRKAKQSAMKLNKEFPDDPHPVRWDQLFAFPGSDSQSQVDAVPQVAPQVQGEVNNA